jgi:methionyl aminopeptidase
MSNIKTPQEIQAISNSAKILSQTLELLESKAKAGITPLQLDEIAEQHITSLNATPAFKGFHGFPSTICASVNDTVVHGIPNNKPLKEGDIITIDCGVLYEGMYSDSAITVGIGKLTPEAQAFIDYNKETLNQAIQMLKPGLYTGDLGSFIEQRTIEGGYYIFHDLIGHGIGKTLHEKPEVPNFGKPGKGTKLKAGMTICVEPIVGMTTGEYIDLPDGWTLKSEDNCLTCQHEHTILITEDGCKVLTARSYEDFSS